jgi:hypothetical protein
MQRRIAVAMLVVAILAGCASLPPAKPIDNPASIVGQWRGTAWDPVGKSQVTLTYKADGTYEFITPNARGTGSWRVADGKVYWSNTAGMKGQATLHEGDGDRVLKAVSDDGRFSSEVRPR